MGCAPLISSRWSLPLPICLAQKIAQNVLNRHAPFVVALNRNEKREYEFQSGLGKTLLSAEKVFHDVHSYFSSALQTLLVSCREMDATVDATHARLFCCVGKAPKAPNNSRQAIRSRHKRKFVAAGYL